MKGRASVIIIALLMHSISYISGSPVLELSPTSLNFGSTTTVLSFYVNNTGTEYLIWNISNDYLETGWLDVDPTSGSTTPGEWEQIWVTVDRSGFSPGIYTHTLRVTSNGGNGTVAVSMTVHGVTVSSKSGGNVTYPGEGTFSFTYGRTINLVTNADNGYRFTGWIGDVGTVGDTNAASTSITIWGYYSITACFERLPILVLDPDHLDFGEEITERTFHYKNQGGGSLTWSLQGDLPGWLSLVPTSGAAAAGESWPALVTVNRTGLNPGNYEHVLSIVSNGGSGNISVVMTVPEPHPTQYELTVESSEGGHVIEPGEGVFEFDADTVIDLLAHANESWGFTCWAGDNWTIENSSNPTTTITMNASYSIIALFSLVNEPPNASFTYLPEEPVINETITFDASASFDPDGEITTWGWSFGDEYGGTGQAVNHSYSSPGRYNVSLTVTDNGGKTDTYWKIVQVLDLLRPDLIVTDVWLEDGMIRYQIRNVGEWVALGDHQTGLLIDGVFRASDLVDADLGPGERWKGCFDYDWECSPLDDEVVVRADYQNHLVETNETNNLRGEMWKCDTTPPRIVSGPTVSDITQTSATISWVTDEDSNSTVEYGTVAGLCDWVEIEPLMVKIHSITLCDLEASTTYHFMVQSTDQSGNTVVSRTNTFETLPEPDDADPNISIVSPIFWKGITMVTANASDDSGVEKVEFFVDGKLVYTDYSPPYGFYVDTKTYENGRHDFKAKVTDLAGKSSEDNAQVDVVNLKDQNDPEVKIISPDKYGKVSGKINVTANVSDDTALLRATLRIDGNWSGDWYPPTWSTKSATAVFPWDTYSVKNGKHRIAVELYDEDINYALDFIDVTVDNTPPPPPPNLVVTRSVTRNGNYFIVKLKVKNVGGEKAAKVRLLDYLQLYQPISYNTSTADYLAEYKVELTSWTMDITSKVDILPGKEITYTYNAVPVMIYPGSLQPLIGGDKYSGPGGSTRIWYEPPSGIETYYRDLKLLLKSYTGYLKTLKSSDYLIVTNPFNLFHLNPAKDVNKLLSSMAELAMIKNGVLGYLGVPSSIPRDIDPNDGFTVGDVIGDGKEEVIIGDISKKRICVSHIKVHNLFGRIWYEYPGFKCGFLEEGFEAGDGLVVGNFEKGTYEYIVMADASADKILVYDGLGWKKMGFPIDYEDYDGLAVGDVVGDSRDEVLIADRSANKVHIYRRTVNYPYWVHHGGFSINYEKHDGFATGDVLGDAKEEIIVADISQNKVLVFTTTGKLIVQFSHSLEGGDGLSVGNVIATWPDKEEIIIGDNNKDEVCVYRGDGLKYKSFKRDFQKNDGLATGKVTGDFGEVLIADCSDNCIDFHRLEQPSGSKYQLNELIKAEVGWQSLFTTTTSATGEWSKRLKSDWIENGYLLIVGETDIIPAWSNKYFGSVLTTKGKWGMIADITDYPYANTYGEEIKPELSTGRIIGNTAYELIKPIQASINVAKGVSGYGFDRSFSLQVSGYSAGLSGGSDPINFDKELFNVALTLKKKGVDGIAMFTPTYTKYKPNGAIDEGATRLAINQNFFANTPEKDVIFLTGHGSGSGWDVIGADNVLQQTKPFGNTNPFIFAASCSTGQYTHTFSIANAFLSRGAAVYLGATNWGLGTHAWISGKFYWAWDTGKSIGLAIKEVKRSIGDINIPSLGPNLPGGTIPNQKERYWSAIYHIFGDPKFGTEGPSTGSLAIMASSPQDDAPHSIDVTIPDYVVNQYNGEDYVGIEGGGVLSLPGLPEVPYYQVSCDYPRGYRIQDVILLNRSYPSIASGLNIPRVVEGVGSITGTTDYDDEWESVEWWPGDDDEFIWSVFEGPNSTTLTITIFPFHYNPLTTDVRFYGNWSFGIDYMTSGVEIVRLAMDKNIYVSGEQVMVDFELYSEIAEGRDVVLNVVVMNEGTGEVVGGMPVRTLKGLKGSATYSSAWNSSNAETGYYILDARLQDAQGTLLDRKIEGFQLGASSGDVTNLEVIPEVDHTQVSMTFNNLGTMDISGTGVILLQNVDGMVIEKSTYDFIDLTPGGSITFTDFLSVQLNATSRITGYVLYNGGASTPWVWTPVDELSCFALVTILLFMGVSCISRKVA